MQAWEGLSEAVALLDAPETDGEPEQKKIRDTPAVELFKLLCDSGVVPFRTVDLDGCFVRFPVSGHFEIAGLKSERFKAWAVDKHFQATGREPQDIYGALMLMEAEAWKEPKVKTYVRVGRCEGKIYLDLCDDGYRAVEIDTDGWRIVENPPVWFLRSGSMLSLPDPQPGGCLTMLRDIISVGDAEFVLLCGWLVASFNPEGPYPVLSLSAEAGSGKSFLTECLKSVFDPDRNPRLSPFKDVDAIFAAAGSRWIMAYDNLTKLTEEDSDHLCRLATGGGFTKRKLYSDNDDFSMSAARPLILNGIVSPVVKMDLLDRAYTIRLNPIPEGSRRTERDLRTAFGKLHPLILGAILTAISCALREQDFYPRGLSRMADAATFTIQAEKGGGLPWKIGTFQRILADMERAKKDEAIQDDAVASLLLEISGADGWSGSLRDFLMLLHSGKTNEELRFLPGTPRAVAKRIEEAKPFLRSLGVRIEKRKTKHGQVIAVAQNPDGAEKTVATGGDVEFVKLSSPSSPYRHPSDIDKHWKSDEGDEGDDSTPAPSVRDEKKFGYPGYPESEVFLGELGKEEAKDRHYRHLRHKTGDSKAPEGDDAVTMVTMTPPPVDTGSRDASVMPPAGWFEAQPVEVRNEYEKLVEDLSDPMMSKGVHDAEQRALKAIWQEHRDAPLPGPAATPTSRGYPLTGVPADVVLPCRIDDGSGRERWLIRTDMLSTGRRLFHTSRSKSGRCDRSFEEPKKGASA